MASDSLKISVSLSFLNGIKNDTVQELKFYRLSGATFYVCINILYINLLNLPCIIRCLFLRNVEPLSFSKLLKKNVVKYLTNTGTL